MELTQEILDRMSGWQMEVRTVLVKQERIFRAEIGSLELLGQGNGLSLKITTRWFAELDEFGWVSRKVHDPYVATLPIYTVAEIEGGVIRLECLIAPETVQFFPRGVNHLDPVRIRDLAFRR